MLTRPRTFHAGMEGLTSLRWLDLTHNCLAGLVELGAVTGAALLGTLAVTEGNLLGRVMQCRLHLVHLLPQAAVLDGQDVTPKEKVGAWCQMERYGRVVERSFS